MVTKLAKNTAYFFVAKNIIQGEDEEVYAYGFELLYSSILNIVIAIVIAIITEQFMSVTLFMVTFIIIRQTIGGYHANTHLGCMSILTVVLLIFVAAARYMPPALEIPASSVSIILSLCVTFMYAPVEHPNKPLSDEDKTRLHKRGIINVCIASLLAAVMLAGGITRRYGFYITAGMLTAAMAMVSQLIYKKINRRAVP